MIVLFVNMTVRYDTVISYKLDFNCKLLRLQLDNWMVRMIIKLQSFTLTATVSKIVSGVRETVLLQNQSRLFKHLDVPYNLLFHNIQIKKNVR